MPKILRFKERIYEYKNNFKLNNVLNVFLEIEINKQIKFRDNFRK